MFVGRQRELKKLNEMYSGNTFEMAVFYGRRRVGKTTLINEFCKTISASANWMFPQTICLIKRYIHTQGNWIIKPLGMEDAI